jgi:hypothetical protein
MVAKCKKGKRISFLSSDKRKGQRNYSEKFEKAEAIYFENKQDHFVQLNTTK